MKKEAWPWIGRNEMGSMSPTGDSHLDISNETYEGYDMLAPVKYTHEGQIAESGSEGMRNTVDSDFLEMQDDEVAVLEDMLQTVRASLAENTTLATIGIFNSSFSQAFLDRNVNVINLSKYSSESPQVGSKISRQVGNPMFYRFATKLDSFIIDGRNLSNEELSISLSNLSEQIAFDGSAIVLAKPNSNPESLIKDSGFSVDRSHCGIVDKFLIKSDLLKNSVVARYYGEDSSEKASFLCDVADSSRKKIDGLQVYSRLKKECGLLFPYEKPTDVMFHMGSVSYPIDIIFIDKESNIKKINKNVQPGSLDVFSCTGVSNVLEISGGMCNLLNIKEGGKIYLTEGARYSGNKALIDSFLFDTGAKRVAFKRSNSDASGFYKIASNNIVKLSSASPFLTSKALRRLGTKELEARSGSLAIDLDGFLESFGTIRLYKSRALKPSDRVYSGMFNETFAIDKKSYIDIPSLKFFTKGMYGNLSDSYSYVDRLSVAKALNDEQKKIIKKISSKDVCDAIIVTRSNLDQELVEVFMEKAAELSFGKKISITSSVFRIPKNFGTKKAYGALRERYGDIDMYAYSFVKDAGMPVSKEVKDKARQALRYINRASELCSKLIGNFKQNMNSYSKLSGDVESVANSKGKYNQSCKRNSRVTKRMLLNVKSGIEILNQIRDISTTTEVITSIAEASKVSSDSIRELFDLIDIIDTEDFVNSLTESTGRTEGALSDAILTLNRAKDYINSDIIGILVLTE